MNYFEFHLGDYARRTGHLSMLEDGGLNRALRYCYVTEGGIPDDTRYRVLVARTKEEREAVDIVLKEFFFLDDGVWRQNRCEEEIAKARVRIEAARSNGRSGGRPRKGPPDKPAGFSQGDQAETQDKPAGFSSGSGSETQSKALQAPDTRSQSPSNHLPSENPSSVAADRTATNVTQLGEKLENIWATPSRSPRKGNRETKNADFEKINERVLSLFVADFVDGRDPPTVQQLVSVVHITEAQARESIRQLTDRGNLPVQSRRRAAS